MSVFTNRWSRSAEQGREYTAAVLGLVGTRPALDVLASTPVALERALAGLSDGELGRREASGKWSIRHVLQHLADAELVWGYRFRMVLAHDRPALTGYDQDAWAERLQYHDANSREAMEQFATLRRAHVRLLRTLAPADLARVGVHAERGEESIEHMMRLNAGHDLLHLRQIDRIRQAVAGGR